MSELKKANAYSQILEDIFLQKFKKGMTEVAFDREEIYDAAKRVGVSSPKNPGDVVYSFRHRSEMPKSIVKTAPKGKSWIIIGTQKGGYKFTLSAIFQVKPNSAMLEINVPDSTPGLVALYALSDEQALLAKLRYNRLIDVFTGLTCYSIQNHLRTTIANGVQTETDELYIGLDRRGAHYVIPVQAKGSRDKLGIVQIIQDIEVCQSKFPGLTCRPIAAQFVGDNSIALFEFTNNSQDIKLAREKHYKLTPSDESTPELFEEYGDHPEE